MDDQVSYSLAKASEELQIDGQTDSEAGDNPASEPLLGPPQQQSQEVLNDVIRMPTSYAELDPGILEQIFHHIPAQQRLVVAAVCRPWRQTFLATSSCWAGIRLGRNSNCFSTTALFTRPTDFLPLISNIQEVQFAPAIPAAVRMLPVTDRLKVMPYLGLALVLEHAHRLKRLDLSALLVKDENIADFRCRISDSLGLIWQRDESLPLERTS